MRSRCRPGGSVETGISTSPTTEPALRTLEEQLDIAFEHRQGLSCRKIARKLGCNPRTVKKYVVDFPRNSGHRVKLAWLGSYSKPIG